MGMNDLAVLAFRHFPWQILPAKRPQGTFGAAVQFHCLLDVEHCILTACQLVG